MQGLLDAGPSMPKQILPRPSKLYFWIFAKRKTVNWKKRKVLKKDTALKTGQSVNCDWKCWRGRSWVRLLFKIDLCPAGNTRLGNTWPLAAGQCVRKNGHFVAAVRWNVVWKVCGCPDSWYSPVTRRHSDTVKPAGLTLLVRSADPGSDV